MNNTGLRVLPPAQPAFIWYPYAGSPEFPQLGSGGHCAMAGPVFYSDLYPEETRMPDYYNGKFFMYDWVRGWFKVVTMKPNGDYDKMEPFMEHTAFNAPIDVEMGPDGRSGEGQRIGVFNFTRSGTAVKVPITPVIDGRLHCLYVVPVSGMADVSAESLSAAYIQFFNK
jgi:hypothetical protein